MRIIKPKDGDRRYVTKFLWLPKRFDGVWVWLETVTIRQMYLGLFGNAYYQWCDLCLSNPLTGLPANFQHMENDKLLTIPLTKKGCYYPVDDRETSYILK